MEIPQESGDGPRTDHGACPPVAGREDRLRREIETARRTRESVCELQRLIRIGGLLRLCHEKRGILRKYVISEEQGRAAEALSAAEERGQFATEVPLTLEQAMIAAGLINGFEDQRAG